MQALRDLRRPRVLHPFMLAACPVLALYGQNAATLTIDRIYPALAVYLLGAFAVWLVLARARGDIHRAGAATSVLLFSGFLVWPILESVIEMIVPIRGTLSTSIALGGVLIALVLACTAWFMRARTRTGRVLIVVALVVFVLLSVATSPAYGRRAAVAISLYCVLSVVIAGSFLVFAGDRFRLTSTGNVFGGALIVLYAGYALVQERAQATLPDWSPTQLREYSIFDSNGVAFAQPDVYVLALDGYPRASVLAEAFQYDNAPFLSDLSSQGFTVAAGVDAAYAEPVHALAACFNLAPVEAWIPETLPAGARAHYIQRALDDSLLLKVLHDRGYECIGFDSGIEALRPSSQFDQTLKPMTVLSEFERILCDRTIAARALQLYFHVRYRNPVYWQFEPTRRYVEFVLERLPLVAEAEGRQPRFVFAYLPVPEPPFIFRDDGARAFPYAVGPLDTARLFFDPEIHRRAFLDQLAYLNVRISDAVREIQANAKRPSVIVVMSLRGAALRGSAAGPPPRAPVLAAARSDRGDVDNSTPMSLVSWFTGVVADALERSSGGRR